MANFGLNANVKATIVVPGQKSNPNDDRLIMIARSTEGKFTITGAVSKLLAIAKGERLMFVNNSDLLDSAIQQKTDDVLEFAEEKGFSIEDIDTVEFRDALYAEHLQFYIAKGYALLKKDGTPVMEAVRTTNETKQKFLDENREEYFNKFKDAIMAKYAEKDENGNYITSEEDVMNMITVDDVKSKEVPAFAGSLTASTSKMSGVGLSLDYTDNTVWKTLKSDLGEMATKKNRIFDVDVENKTNIIINNGCSDVTITVYPITFAEDVDPMDRSKKNEE